MLERTRMVEAADKAAATGDLISAERFLVQAIEAGEPDLILFLKLAGVRRARGQLQEALASVNRALATAPLDFTALLMRASLLEKLGDPRAGSAWAHALAQRPNGQVPPHLSPVIDEAQRKVAAWTDAREAQMQARMNVAEGNASSEELARIERFRSNALRRTRHYHSEPTDFHYPELVEREFHPRRLFPWIEELEGKTATLLAEFQAATSAERADIVPYVQYDEHLPLAQWRALNHSPDWSAIHLLQRGNVVAANGRHCPQTMALLERLPQPRIPGASPNAMFSLLAPRTSIPPHVGVNNARLVCHLPLIVPEGCWFRVGAETRHWQPGEAFVFDDTIEHEAMNPSDELRVVFIFDVWHPDLSEVEREAVAALIASENVAGEL